MSLLLLYQLGGGRGGALSVNEAADTLAATAAVKVTCSVSVTEDADTVSAAAQAIIHAAASIAEAADTLGAAGKVAIHCQLSVTVADSILATGTAAQPASGLFITHFFEVGGVAPPPNVYVAEDGATYYVTENGKIFYVQES